MRKKEVDTRDAENVYYSYENETILQTIKRLNPITTVTLLATPLIAAYGLFTVSWTLPTLLWTLVYYFLTGLGITAGYHRLWSHRAYNAHWIVRFFLMIFGTGAAQGSIRWWGRNHRIHHRYTDTPFDPYNARQGFWWSHLGWMLFTKDFSRGPQPHFDISDFESDPMVMWQNKNYWWFAPFMSFGFPTLVAGLGWGDWAGGYFFAAVLRLVFVHHATFCVNSLAHWLGDQPFADDHTPKDHFLTAFITLGEGYHNFHHEFPFDYRNAVKWWQYDPTKWLINVLFYFGLAWDLKEFGNNEIQMGVWQMQQKRLQREKAKYQWGPADESLPTITWSDYLARSKSERIVVIDKYVLNVEDWVNEHPGGPVILDFVGKDATEAFSGHVHAHSQVAAGLTELHRVALVADKPSSPKQKTH